MQEILYDYKPMSPTTWVYLSSLIMIAVYFKFRRFWSVRNLDLVGLILFAPGLLLVARGRELGYLWLFVVGGFFLLRMLADSAMVRRPLLEPNLSASGLSFACAAMLVFLMSNVIAPPPPTPESAALVPSHEKPQAIGQARAPGPPGRPDAPNVKDENLDTVQILRQRGPGYPLFHVFSSGSEDPIKQATAIIAHLAVVLGMVLIGYRHFDNTHTGIAAATLYLLMPYTANYTPRIDHVVPAALLVWAIQSYRRPVVAGILVGLAAGLIWYPLFLLPLWCSFYWRRGLLRFSLAVLVVLGLVAASLAFAPSSLGPYHYQFSHAFGMMTVDPPDIRGFWEGSLAPFRWPVLAAFVAMCGSMALWPAQKNLGSLLACSAAIMLGTQFWKAYEGGTYMAWYLPLLILTIFRPNLEDRVALSAISEGWVKWRK